LPNLVNGKGARQGRARRDMVDRRDGQVSQRGGFSWLRMFRGQCQWRFGRAHRGLDGGIGSASAQCRKNRLETRYYQIGQAPTLEGQAQSANHPKHGETSGEFEEREGNCRASKKTLVQRSPRGLVRRLEMKLLARHTYAKNRDRQAPEESDGRHRESTCGHLHCAAQLIKQDLRKDCCLPGRP